MGAVSQCGTYWYCLPIYVLFHSALRFQPQRNGKNGAVSQWSESRDALEASVSACQMPCIIWTKKFGQSSTYISIAFRNFWKGSYEIGRLQFVMQRLYIHSTTLLPRTSYIKIITIPINDDSTWAINNDRKCWCSEPPILWRSKSNQTRYITISLFNECYDLTLGLKCTALFLLIFNQHHWTGASRKHWSESTDSARRVLNPNHLMMVSCLCPCIAATSHRQYSFPSFTSHTFRPIFTSQV